MAEFKAVKDEESGEYFLPATRRPDGTWRKPIKVKQGYIPQDEVPAYESKGKQWVKSQPAYPIGMNPALMVPADQKKKSKDGGKPTIPGLPPAAAAKKKKKTKAAKAAETPAVKEVTGKLAGFTIEEPTFTPAAATAPVSVGAPSTGKAPEDAKDSSSGSSDPAKRLKNVKKKLASIEALEAKLKSGELKNPDKDQLEKIKRKSEVIKEIKELEKLVK